MNKIVLQLLVLGFCIAIGQALQCYDGKIGADEDMCITTKTDCAAEELWFIVPEVGLMDIKMKGCLKVAECDKTTEMEHPDNAKVYSMVNTCCNTDLCNGVANLLGASKLSLALATVTALLMAQVLV